MKAYRLLQNEENWGKGYKYKNNRWCLVGAIDKCYPNLIKNIYFKFKLYKLIGNVYEFNDNKETQHSDIIKLLKDLNI